jgi:hypothetical protein
MVAKHTAAAVGLLIASFGSASAQTFSSSAAAVSREASAVGSLSLARQGFTPTSAALPRVFVPTLPRTAYTRYPWKTDIVATVFWIGESPTENNPVPNDKSSWDPAWAKNYGGYDDPDPSQRGRNFCPVKFTPRQNPFYVALPYNDVLNHETTKREAANIIPWYKERFVKAGKSVVKGQWIAIRHGNRVCYAQWEDCGPFVTDDADYVFGDARPKNNSNDGAGIDVSPAVRDYLGMSSGRKCDWRFVDLNEIPDGPWRDLGTNNHFVQNKTKAGVQQNDLLASRLEELRRMRDEYFRKNGNSQYLR